ncbi:MAG: NAD(P)-binding domain-containing protein [Deltaproteobacteria bacterium]|nr:NAD(P)-binding domain-containing protein [Deltaproteobacteria bacterium]
MSASELSTVGVLGGGRWGLALVTAASRAGRAVCFCTRRAEQAVPEGVSVTTDYRVLSRSCTLILVATPSDVVRDVARQLGDEVDGSHFLVHGIRGLSGEGLVPVSAILREETPCRRVGALAGPAVAEDLVAGRPGVIAVASRYPEVTQAVSEALGSPTLRVYPTSDLLGAEWASALTGVLLLALGYARASGLPPALVAGLLTRATHECSRIGAAAGGEEKTFLDLPGIGDLLAAMGQTERPEVRLGELLGQGASLEDARERVGQRVEAPMLVPRVVAFARERRLRAPIIETLGAVLAGRLGRDEAFKNLMEFKG